MSCVAVHSSSKTVDIVLHGRFKETCVQYNTATNLDLVTVERLRVGSFYPSVDPPSRFIFVNSVITSVTGTCVCPKTFPQAFRFSVYVKTSILHNGGTEYHQKRFTEKER
jgi:hypothetical protein